jgi:membrane protein required for colicin V production
MISTGLIGHGRCDGGGFVQTYDLIMLAVLIGAGIFGAVKGFAWQIASIASLAISYVVACRYREQAATYIDAEPPWNSILAMLLLYVGTSFAIWIGFRVFSGMIDKVKLKEFDRHLGAILGMLKGSILCLLITMFGMTLLGSQQQEAICQSRSGYFIAQVLQRADGVLPKEVNEVVGPYLDRLDQQLRDGGVQAAPSDGNFWESTLPNSNSGNGTRAGESGGAPPASQDWNFSAPWNQAQQNEQPLNR